jgi:molybdopterin molybdotransferase
MISVQEAFSILQNNLPEFKQVSYSLIQARKHVLAQDIFSPVNMPPFRQSAMDGFALCLSDESEYIIVGEVKAGDSHQVKLLPGQAVKIFTGAAVPDSAQAVIQVEKVSEKKGRLLLEEEVKPNTNIRPIGARKGHFAQCCRHWFFSRIGNYFNKSLSKTSSWNCSNGQRIVETRRTIRIW